ncbi:MAG: helix-turn-helix domain-containing protein [Candidatus Tectimicrobiota bacterium]
MSRQIIASLRHHDELHGSLFLTAIELAHRADGNSGIVRISYSYLASKCHYSIRTAFRHVQRLIDLGIITRQRFCQFGKKWFVNAYTFRIAWEHPKPTLPAQMGNSGRMAENLPHPQKDKEKYGSLREEEKGIEKVLSWLTPGSMLSRLMGGQA